MRRADFRPSDSEPLLSDFTLETVIDPKYRNQLDRALRILPVKLVESVEHSSSFSSSFKLKYSVLFEPLKSLKGAVEIVVSSKRGRWRGSIEVEATDPAPEDTIRLTAAVGGSDKISFRLSNRFLGSSNYRAYFGPKSSPHFSVTPTSGVLAPFGTEGTQFIVNFSPLVYGTKETYVPSSLPLPLFDSIELTVLLTYCPS
jgi:hypothetical protein